MRPYFKITMRELSPLFQLQGDTDPKSPRVMTQEAIKALALVEEKLSDARIKQISYDKEWDLIILRHLIQPLNAYGRMVYWNGYIYLMCNKRCWVLVHICVSYSLIKEE